MTNQEDLRLAPDDDYDAVPYTSMPYADTQPSHLAALMALHGLPAPAIESAHVLELGCASGGNLIPLAARYPHAHFVGVDLSRQHIVAGRQRASRLGLANIDLRQGDVTDVSLGERTFDYIICHGLYSWAPPEAQGAVLRICQEKLSPSGAAVISYNVLPGWRLRQAIRDICLQHAGSTDPARLRIARVREILNEIAAASSGTEPYSLLMRSEARRIAHRPGSYILGEFLAKHNSPCFFTDFLAQVDARGLEYVCESDLEASERALPAGDTMARIAGGEALAQRAYADYFTGRTFRSSLLRRRGLGGRVSPQNGALRRLYLSAALSSVPGAGSARTFKDPRGRIIAPQDRHVQGALSRLAGAYPNSLSWSDLGASLPPEAQTHLENALSLLAQAGQVRLSASALKVAGASDEHPLLWELARLEIADGQPWVTGLNHMAVALKPLVKILAPLLDGLHNRARLAERILAAFSQGEVAVPEIAGPADASRLRTLAETYRDRTLRHLARNALLAPHDR